VTNEALRQCAQLQHDRLLQLVSVSNFFLAPISRQMAYSITLNKQLCYRRRTVRRAMPIKIQPWNKLCNKSTTNRPQPSTLRGAVK